jgi:hypothetical protein
MNRRKATFSAICQSASDSSPGLQKAAFFLMGVARGGEVAGGQQCHTIDILPQEGRASGCDIVCSTVLDAGAACDATVLGVGISESSTCASRRSMRRDISGCGGMSREPNFTKAANSSR